MLHKSKKKRQVIFGDALLIERENEIAGPGVDQEVGILDPLGDALVGKQVADVINRKEAGVVETSV
jgi:hypothetical protein